MFGSDFQVAAAVQQKAQPEKVVLQCSSNSRTVEERALKNTPTDADACCDDTDEVDSCRGVAMWAILCVSTSDMCMICHIEYLSVQKVLQPCPHMLADVCELQYQICRIL